MQGPQKAACMSDPLHDEAAELAILGAVIVRNAALDDLPDLLAPEDFGRTHHQKVFAAMQRLHKAGQPIDPITLASTLTLSRDLDDVGQAFLYSLGDGVPRSTNVSAYAAQVRDLALSRRLVSVARGIQAQVEDRTETGAAVLEHAEQAIYALGTAEARSDWETGTAVSNSLFPMVEQMSNTHRPVTGLTTPFEDLDFVTRGLHPGDMITLGARPGSGKTSFGLQLAMHAAAMVPVAFFSVEMAIQPLGLRAVIAHAQVDGHRLLSGGASDVEHRRVSDGLSALGRAHIHFDESATLSPLHVRSRLRRLAAKVGPLGLVVLDYLQLLAPLPEDRRENKTNQLEGISRALKVVAREFNVPFLVLAQLNRGLERSTEKRPMLSDLRGSGAIEQDSDVVLLLHRPEMYERDNAALDGVTELIVAKNRNGPITMVPLYFHKSQMRFETPRRQ